jgi:hypothetical protein
MRRRMPFLPPSHGGRWRAAPEGSWASEGVVVHDPSVAEDGDTSPRFAQGGQ